MKRNVNIKFRLNRINKVMLLILFIIVLKLSYMTIFENSYYRDLANQKTYKQIMIKAPRGEIKDRNGVVLAGDEPEFTCEIVADTFNKVADNDGNKPNRVAYSIINILDRNKEKYEDNFPIKMGSNGKYYYTFDEKIEKFKKQNSIPMDYSAKKCFYRVVDILIKNDLLSYSDKNLEPIKLQAKLNSLGYYPPVLVNGWVFTEEKNKKDWLNSYNLKSNTSAKDAFNYIKNKYYKIDPSIPNSEARKIMLVRDLIKSKIYTQYNPIILAKGISQKTVSQIEENAINMPGVNVGVIQKRIYPFSTLASHVLGYMGSIPASKVEDMKSEGYDADDLIGISGIEHSFEDMLRGRPGYKEVKVDSVGRVIEEMKSIPPKSGNDVYLTIDSKLQKVSEDALKRAIIAANTSGNFKSQFGDIKVGEYAPNAKSGALVAIDVKNGDVLSMASYPNFDPNKFVGGITTSDYDNYLPKNKNDLLAPNPLLNLATQGAFQPGSTFKLVTAMAALESGLNPYYSIHDTGVIKLGRRNFADYVWHHGGHNHGITNLFKAIQESCNIYFYIIGSNFNWLNHTSLNINMGAKKILEYARLFGLDDKTGLENQLEERNGKVPSEEEKLKTTKLQLKYALEKTMRNHFDFLNPDKDKEEYENKINTIVSWIDEPKTPGRGETIRRLKALGVDDKYVDSDADFIVYSYFNFAKWGIGDTFNLAIGQGENAYNPVQIARYIAAIANGGKLVKLNVVKDVETPKGRVIEKIEKSSTKIPFKNDNNLKIIKEGMVRVSTEGLAKKAFKNFPVLVATKTGTAQKSGKIPSNNEFDYLMSHLGYYSLNKNEVLETYQKLKAKKEAELTSEKISELKAKIKNPSTSEEDKEKYEEDLKSGVKVRLENSDRINSYYLRKAIKELNPKLTDIDIDRFKQDYGSFAWCVAFAPANDPQIAVVCMIPQGESSSYAVLPIREVLGQYFGLLKPDAEAKVDKTKK